MRLERRLETSPNGYPAERECGTRESGLQREFKTEWQEILRGPIQRNLLAIDYPSLDELAAPEKPAEYREKIYDAEVEMLIGEAENGEVKLDMSFQKDGKLQRFSGYVSLGIFLTPEHLRHWALGEPSLQSTKAGAVIDRWQQIFNEIQLLPATGKATVRFLQDADGSLSLVRELERSLQAQKLTDRLEHGGATANRGETNSPVDVLPSETSLNYNI